MGAASEEDFDIHNQKAIFWADSRSLEKKQTFPITWYGTVHKN